MADQTPVRIGYRTGRSGGGSTMDNVTYAAGSAVNDVVLLLCWIQSATTRVTVPAEWTQIGDPVTDGARTMQLLAHRLTEADLAEGSADFALTAGAGITWSSMTLRGTEDPASWVLGTFWTRDGFGTTVSAPAVDVAQAGSLVLGLLVEASTEPETQDQVVASGMSRWFFQPHQTTIPQTHVVTYLDNAVVGQTSSVNVTYPAASQSQDAVGVQLVIPGAQIAPPSAPSSLFAGTYGFGTTWLTMGARTQDVLGQVRVEATPVLGGATVISQGLATPDAYGWVSCRVGGLTPNVAYNLVMFDVETNTALATVQATTVGGIRSDFKVVTSSCQKSNEDVAIFNEMAAEGASFFAHQGDLHYQDADTEASWRFGLNANMAQPAMKALMASTPMTYRWDNHDWGGNQSWRESPPKAWAPQAIRNLMGVETFTDETGVYRTWSHNGIRFIDADLWSLRDEADTDPSTNSTAGKTMLGIEQRDWLFSTLRAATEPLIIWFASFPLYGNYVGNGRWGNFLDEAAIIDSWLGANPDVKERLVAVGGDSHDIRADLGTATMWGIPSLNASPLNRVGDVTNTPSSSIQWGYFIGPATVSGTTGTIDTQVYSLLEFAWNADRTEVTFTWTAKRTGGATVASWSKVFADTAASGITRLVGGAEQPVAITRMMGGVEVPVTLERYVPA